MKHQQFNIHSTPCCLALVVQTNQEASGWVETKEKVNTHHSSPSSGLFNLVSFVFRPSSGGSSFPVIAWWLKDCVNALRTVYFQFEYEEQGKRRLLGWSRHNLKMCRSKDNACDFGKNQQRRSSRKILKTMKFNLSTGQNMGRFRKWLVTGSFIG